MKVQRTRADDRDPDRSALAGRRPGMRQVAGVLLLGLGLCVVPHLVWLLIDSTRLELVEPSSPRVLLDLVLLGGFVAGGAWLLKNGPDPGRPGS